MADLRYLSLDRSKVDEPYAIRAATPSGQIRNIPLTEKDLMRLIERAAVALQVLAREEERDRG